MRPLRGKRAIVTGASRGLGVHIARSMANQGMDLVLTARSADALESVSEELQTLGVRALPRTADLCDSDAVTGLVDEAESSLGPIDVLVNNAGVQHTTPFREARPEELELTVAVNLLAPMLLTRALLPRMLDRGRGHIVNVASLAGKIGLPHSTAYASTKAGLIMFTQTLRIELAGSPVGASVVCPGFVSDDGMFARANAAVDSPSPPPLLRPTTPKRVADAVLRCIQKDPAELIVNPIPVRPMAALLAAFPGSTPRVHRFLGTTRLTERLGEAESEQAGRA